MKGLWMICMVLLVHVTPLIYFLLKKLIVSIIPRLTKIRCHTVRCYRSLIADGFDARSNSRNSDLPIPPTRHCKAFPFGSVTIVIGVPPML
mgnify:CR=1 FL=1